MKIGINLHTEFYLVRQSSSNRTKYFVMLFAFMLGFTIKSYSKNYYFSSSIGNDSYTAIQAQDPNTPWKTIDQLNRSMNLFTAGDYILFNRSDTFYGNIKISKSGTAGSPITIGAYGTGEKPIITGFTTISSWTKLGSNIWESTSAVSTLPTCNMVTINGMNTGRGRYPNKGYLTYQSSSGNTSITSNSLSGTPNWTGAEIVLRKNHFIIDRSNITSHYASTLTFASGSNYLPTNGFGFFIQNDARTLDIQNEWYYNPSTKKIKVYSLRLPTNVQVATVETFIYITSKSYLTFDNISFSGSNKDAFVILSSSNITIQNCSFDFSGINAITAVHSSYLDIVKSSFNHTNNNALSIGEYQDATTNHILVSEDTIRNTGILVGMGKSIDDQTEYSAIFLVGSNNTIEKCVIDSTGYIPIYWGGESFNVKNNFITNFSFVKDDGGAIWTWNNGKNPVVYNNQKVLNNIILNGIGALEGSIPNKLVGASGIYVDNNGANIEISGNTVANCNGHGILIHSSHEITVKNNTSYNNDQQISIYSDNMITDDADGVSLIRNIDVEKNIFLAKTSSQYGLSIIITFNDLSSFGTIDNNYYARPIDNNFLFLADAAGGGTHFIGYTLAGWQTYSGFDSNSHKSSFAVADTADIDFYYNVTKANKVIQLDQPMIDVRGTKYFNSITLLPFTSVVLMVDPDPTQPVIPVYTGSVINNATPSLLEITYNVSLTNIVPAASVFTVQVNSVVRTINSVAISGTQVLLTLASRIVYGDVITITYTKPTSNPLQATSTGIAASISNQHVVNNCINVAPAAVITSPINNNSFTANANITITANATDPDRSIIMVEFYNGSTKIGTKSAAPYSLTWNNVAEGIYSLTVIATDNLNAKTTSSAISISVIKGTTTVNQPPVVTISNPRKGNKYENPATITIDAVASDPDGTISKVEFYSGAVRLFELTLAPYTYTWKDVAAGTYAITAIATDNLNATTTSSPVEFVVGPNIKYDANSEIINLYPNPNDGHFSIEFINPLENEKSELVITDLAGKKVYSSPISKEETTKQIDLSCIKSGIYILMIIYKEILITKKIIKY